MAKSRNTVTVDGRTFDLSHLDKVMYPSAGLTKAKVIDYYRRVAPVMLPHLAGRAVVLNRYPGGVDGPSFHERRCPSYRPEWLETLAAPDEDEHTTEHCVIRTPADLVWIANLASLEIHTFLSKADALDRATAVAFDLQATEPAGLLQAAEAAITLREMIRGVGLIGAVKTAGARGLHVLVPLNADATFDDTRDFARAVAGTLERHCVDKITGRIEIGARRGKVLVDWTRNGEYETFLAPYSLIAQKRPLVSTPVTWEEVEAAVERQDEKRLLFEHDAVLKRVEKKGDLFDAALQITQRLPL